MVDQPLKGVRVCDFGQHGAGSVCGKVLADWGADVIKIEPFWGCGSRKAGMSLGLNCDPEENIHTEMVNGGKRSIAIDLKSPEGLEIAMRIIAKSNIFFSNYRMKALVKYGFDYDTLSAEFPHLIWGHINGYGTEGPLAEAPGYDGTSYWAASGLLMNPTRSFGEDHPINNPFGAGDMITGYILASSLAACLYQQATTGKGQRVYTSLFGAGIWQNSCVVQASIASPDTYPKTHSLFGGFFQSKDGVWFTTSVMDFQKQGGLLANMIGHDELSEVFSAPFDKRNNALSHRSALEDYYAQHTWDEINARLKDIDIVHCRVARPAELGDSEQARANGYIYDFTTRNGEKAPMISTPVKFGKQEPILCTHAPLIGEQTTEILRALSYSQAEIDSLFQKHIVEENRDKTSSCEVNE